MLIQKQYNKIIFAGIPNRVEGATMLFTFEGVKETVLDFSKGTVKVLWFYLILI